MSIAEEKRILTTHTPSHAIIIRCVINAIVVYFAKVLSIGKLVYSQSMVNALPLLSSLSRIQHRLVQHASSASQIVNQMKSVRMEFVFANSLTFVISNLPQTNQFHVSQEKFAITVSAWTQSLLLESLCQSVSFLKESFVGEKPITKLVVLSVHVIATAT